MKLPKRILIEPALFGDFFIAIYDSENNMLLDRKYFTAGKDSALITVIDMLRRREWKNLPVYELFLGGLIEVPLKEEDIINY